MTDVKAQLKSLRMAPRKVRSVVGLLRGKNAVQAVDQLEHFARRPVGPLKKLLNSAIANAENNFNMVKDNLFIKKLIVDEGIKLKRFRAKGFGRAAPLQKKTSHITVILGERTPGLKRDKQVTKKKEEKEIKVEDIERNQDIKKPEIKREISSKGYTLGNLGKKLFQRKAI